jgi:hypothetical protein
VVDDLRTVHCTREGGGVVEPAFDHLGSGLFHRVRVGWRVDEADDTVAAGDQGAHQRQADLPARAGD